MVVFAFRIMIMQPFALMRSVSRSPELDSHDSDESLLSFDSRAVPSVIRPRVVVSVAPVNIRQKEQVTANGAVGLDPKHLF